MNFAVIKTALTSKAGLQLLAAQKHSPVILFGAGVVGMVGTVVLASKATLQMDGVLDEFETKKRQIKQARNEHPTKYSEAAAKSDGVIVHSKLIRDLVRLYAPAVGLGLLSIGALGGSHVILTRRNAGLMAAYAAVDKAFKEYRGRVSASLGEDKDREFMFGTTEREIYSEKKNGEPKVTRVNSFGSGRSPYAMLFDQDNLNWQTTPQYNAFFLRLAQNHLNDRLRARGHVFLNDVYRELGMEDTKAGAVTGWIWNSENGDNFVDFGIWDGPNRETFHDFVMGYKGAILLDFNVDGVIYDKIGKGGK